MIGAGSKGRLGDAGSSRWSQSRIDVIPFARTSKSSPPEYADQLDQAGQTLLQLVQKAAGVAEENSRHALEMAQRLSHQLRASEDRIAKLETEVAAYRDRAERAEQWLHRRRNAHRAQGGVPINCSAATVISLPQKSIFRSPCKHALAQCLGDHDPAGQAG